MWIHFYVYCGDENKYYDTYKYYPRGISTKDLEEYLQDWTNEHWWAHGECGYQQIESPPLKWLKERVS